MASPEGEKLQEKLTSLARRRSSPERSRTRNSYVVSVARMQAVRRPQGFDDVVGEKRDHLAGGDGEQAQVAHRQVAGAGAVIRENLGVGDPIADVAIAVELTDRNRERDAGRRPWAETPRLRPAAVLAHPDEGRAKWKGGWLRRGGGLSGRTR